MNNSRTWVRRTPHVLRPDHSRVISTIFLPGQELDTGESRSTAVLNRALALSDDEVEATVTELEASFGNRHRDLRDTWLSNFGLMVHRIQDAEGISMRRRELIGAYFTMEYAIEGAALFNPSMVPHPDQTGLPEGSTRFIMTLRAVGEGHISSLEFRTGTISATNTIAIDAPPEVAVLSTAIPTVYSKAAFQHQLREASDDHTNADFVLDDLPDSFTRHDLGIALEHLRDERLTRGTAEPTFDSIQWIAACSYAAIFPEGSSLQERVLMPRAPSESQGIEDVRLVRFAPEPGLPSYVGTYTAFNGRRIETQLIHTEDFRSFTIEQTSGPGSKNKGMALFPRRIGGQFAALSRADRESNGISLSDDLRHWDRRVLVQKPMAPWETVQLGNCGSPIETEAGWIALTHGVGAMREYSIGALLLDLEDPSIVLGRLRQPLLAPTPEERNGYVPNVVYSCGAMLHGRTLVLPYGCSDSATRIALVDLDALLDELREGTP